MTVLFKTSTKDFKSISITGFKILSPKDYIFQHKNQI